MFNNNEVRRDIDGLRTTLGEFRISMTAQQVQMTDAIARIAKLEAANFNDALALQKFSQHVESCDKTNGDAARTASSFRKELRGYVVTIVIMLVGGLGIALYNGLHFPGLH